MYVYIVVDGAWEACARGKKPDESKTASELQVARAKDAPEMRGQAPVYPTGLACGAFVVAGVWVTVYFQSDKPDIVTVRCTSIHYRICGTEAKTRTHLQSDRLMPSVANRGHRGDETNSSAIAGQ